MVKFYALRIKMKKMTIDEVPEKYREAVQKELDNEQFSFLIEEKCFFENENFVEEIDVEDLNYEEI